MIGPGKYNEELTALLKRIGASEGLLLVFDGLKGPGFCSQLSLESILNVPDILRGMAAEIEAGLARGGYD